MILNVANAPGWGANDNSGTRKAPPIRWSRDKAADECVACVGTAGSRRQTQSAASPAKEVRWSPRSMSQDHDQRVADLWHLLCSIEVRRNTGILLGRALYHKTDENRGVVRNELVLALADALPKECLHLGCNVESIHINEYGELCSAFSLFWPWASARMTKSLQIAHNFFC